MTTLSTEMQRRVERAARRVDKLATFQRLLIDALRSVIDLSGNHQHVLHALGDLMARTQQELLDEIAGLKSAIQADSASDQDVVNTLDALVADLRAQVAAGQAIDTEALFAAIDDAKAQIQPATSMTEPPTP